MSVFARPINEDDYDLGTGRVSAVINKYAMMKAPERSIMDDKLFGVTTEHKAEKNKKFEDEYTRTATVDLAIPVLNPFLAGNKGRVIQTILGKQGPDVEAIMYGRLAYNRITGKVIQRDTNKSLTEEIESMRIPYKAEEWLIGGEYIAYLLDNFDAEKAIEDYLYMAFINQLFPKEMRNDWRFGVYYGKIRKVEDDELFTINDDGSMSMHPTWIFDKYVWDAGDAYIGYWDEDKAKVFRTSELYTESPRLSFLLSYIKNEKQVKDMIMDYIFVLPVGYRPNTADAIEPINVQYNELIKRNQELTNCISYVSAPLFDVMDKYNALVEQLRYVFVGGLPPKGKPVDSYRCLQQRLSAKSGLIRDKMLGNRTDYSGRSVITCDPNMPLDCVGVPKKVLNKLLELDLAKDELIRTHGTKNVNYINRVENVATMRDRASEMAQEDQYIIIGRQPTLFYLGIQGYKVIPVDGSSLVLSPLVVMPFNADFDGDTMHYSWPVTEEAKYEVRTLMASTKNLFYPRNGELTVVPRHEIIYGLWICAVIRDVDDPHVQELGAITPDEDSKHIRDLKDSIKRVAKTWTEEELAALAQKLNDSGKVSRKLSTTNIIEIVYEGVCLQEINVYDKISSSKGYGKNLDGKSAGLWAIRYVAGKGCSDYVIGGTSLKKYSDTYKTKDDNGNEVECYYDDYPADKEYKDATLTKWFKNILTKVKEGTEGEFIDTVNRMVRLGFAVAEIWPPSVTGIVEVAVKDVVDEFNQRMYEHEEFVNMGIEIQDAYTSYYDDEYEKLMDVVKDRVVQSLGNSNGFIRMWHSGAKGSKSNLTQIFGIKGRIMKDESTPFNTIIGNSLMNQLSGLEHFISAYGSRQGIVDKVLSTAEPGYLTRQLEHTAIIIDVTEDDCKTTDGVVWTYDDVLPFIDSNNITFDDTINNDQVKEYLSKLLVGRWVVTGTGREYVSNIAIANTMYDRFVARVDATKNEDGTVTRSFRKLKGVVVRSPLTCKNPCCAVCYGKDLTRNEQKAKIGKPIGYVAAQAIGEPGTQLTMKNFQSGGVVRNANLTSAFDTISKYLHLTKQQRNNLAQITYDALSNKEGFVKTIAIDADTKKIGVVKDYDVNKLEDVVANIIFDTIKLDDGSIIGITKDLNNPFKDRFNFTIKLLEAIRKKDKIIAASFPQYPELEGVSADIDIDEFYGIISSSKAFNGNTVGSRKLMVDNELLLKRYVEVGDSFQRVQGYLDIKEALAYRSHMDACKYLILILYDIFNKETDISVQHFEVLISTMISYIVEKGNDEVATGTLLNIKEYWRLRNRDNLKISKTITSIEQLPKYKKDFFESMFMEDMGSYVPRNLVINPVDTMTNPKSRIALGLRMGMGTDVPEFGE